MRLKLIKSLLFYCLLILILCRIILYILPFSEFSSFKAKPYSLQLLDRHGKLLHVFPLEGGKRREYISYNDVPGHVKEIFIRSEDKRFFYHNGIDIIAVMRAFYINITGRSVISGASTISMQLSRFVSPNKRDFPGKIREGINAIRLEGKCRKEELFELWINAIPFGLNTIGIASACKAYFHKNVKNLSELETCILAVILRNPLFYDPLDEPERVIQKAVELAHVVLTRHEVSYIFPAVRGHHYTSGKADISGIKEEIRAIVRGMTPFQWPFYAPHFSLYVKNHLSPANPGPGNTITTSLDFGLYQVIENKIRDKLQRYHKNRLTNGAALILNNKTGEILAYVGSNDFYDKDHGGEIDGLHIRNQPGSCLKPFLYGLGLEMGYLPNSILPDIPMNFGTREVYTPVNFNNRFHGPVRFRVALASSLNVPAVYLITRLGVENFRQKLIDLGFDSLKASPRSSGSGLALGNAEVSLFELTRAFSVFPGKGRKIIPVWKKVFAREGPGKEKEKGDRVFSPYTASMICHILSENASRALGFTTHSVLNTDVSAMFKTGTSDQFGNIWALGATEDYTVGVWMGNFSGETVVGMPGSSIPAHIVVDIIKLLQKKPNSFPPPENSREVRICSLSGQGATDICPGTIVEYLPLDAPVEPCQFHVREKGVPILRYPPLYDSWVREQSGTDTNLFPQADLDFPFIRRPRDGEHFYLDPVIPLSQQALNVEIIHDNRNDILTIYVNGIKKTGLSYPYEWVFPLERGVWNIEVRDMDSTDSVTISVQ